MGIHTKGSHEHTHPNGTVHTHPHFHKKNPKNIHIVIHLHKHKAPQRMDTIIRKGEISPFADHMDNEISGYLFSLYSRYAREKNCSLALARVEVHTKLFKIVAEHLN